MFWEIFTQLCANIGESPNKVAKKLSIASGTVTEWKKGRIPQNATLKKLADFFGVSVDYLLGKEDKKEKLPASNEEFMAMLREHNKGTAQVFFCGADGEVVELTPEEQAMLRGLLDLRKKKD